MLGCSFWSLNGGLMAMCLLSLLPVGRMQTWASIEHGYWNVRSSEFMQRPLMQNLRWMRVPGDTVFFLGAVALVVIVAGLFASLGVWPLLIRKLDLQKRIGLGYGFAGGLMFAVSVYNLLLPAFSIGADQAARLWPVVQTLTGKFLGCLFLWAIEVWLTPERLRSRWLRVFGGRVSALVFLSMTFHSIPEGLAWRASA